MATGSSDKYLVAHVKRWPQTLFLSLINTAKYHCFANKATPSPLMNVYPTRPTALVFEYEVKPQKTINGLKVMWFVCQL